jgi:endonuclease YncB( thermonuclease family)
MGYPFKPLELRAQCLSVHDGDTALMFIDRGDYDYSLRHVRFVNRDGVGFDAFELKDKDPAKRKKAAEARDLLKQWLTPLGILDIAKLDEWPLRIVTKKDEDHFGRWLAEVYFKDTDGVEKNAAEELLKLGLGVPWKK